MAFIGKSLQYAERYAEEEESGNSLKASLFENVLEQDDLGRKLLSEKETKGMSNTQCGIHKKVSEDRRRGNHPWALKIIGNLLIHLITVKRQTKPTMHCITVQDIRIILLHVLIF